VIVFPNCKINLGLHILQKRADGFHDLETIFYPISIQDGLEVIQNSITTSDEVDISSSGLPIDPEKEDNICYKAYQLLKQDFPELPAVKMHLHKVIPSGAGLGGGSADGAFTLLLLNKKFNLGLNDQRLTQYAFQLGSDCPFFILNRTCFATGRGEILEPLHLDLSDYNIVVVNPGIHINTGWAFSQIAAATEHQSLKQIVALPVKEWKEHLKNDFEKPVFSHYPEIETIKKQLYKQGAIYASMTGSGSTVYGLFEKNVQVQLSFPPHYFVKSI